MRKDQIIWRSIVVLLLFTGAAAFSWRKAKPVLYIIGDSTVRNGDGTGKNGQWGWGSFLAAHFDTGRISLQNHAIGGRSSRTFITEGRWDKIMTTLKKGDYVLMQFGHNDASPLDDTARARGTINGIGAESKEIWNPITKQKEMVYTYGHYMRRYIRDAKAKGALPIMCSLVPRNNWKEGKIVRSDSSYGLWTRSLAKEEGIPFIDLNNLIAHRYEALGSTKVAAYFPYDHTHTEKEGALLNAAIVAQAIDDIKPGKLHRFLRDK